MKYYNAIFLSLIASPLLAAEPVDAVASGKQNLETKAYIKAFWPKESYDNAWKTWGVKQKPADYDAAFRERYGLHKAPYENGSFPMGLRKADLIIGKGIGIDCMACHGGSINGRSYVGLGNNSLDFHSLFEEMTRATGTPVKMPFDFSKVRGTSEAGAFAVYLLGFRTPELDISPKYQDLDLHDDSCEDVPAWWLLKKKKTMYHIGATDSRSVRSLMQFMMHVLTTKQEFRAAESDFKDVQKYIMSIEAPKYPYVIDQAKAIQGEKVFIDNCAKCHGTYGDKWTYPNKVIPLAEIGTDRKRYDNIGLKFAEAYLKSWFAQEKGIDDYKYTKGYQAPPLDGIWATAPYFHNGSVPTLDGVLNSKARPKVYTRSFKTDEADCDKEKVGWKITELKATPSGLSGFEQRKIYDTTQPGRGNAGHTYGDDLKKEEREKLIEYLKTL